MTRALGVKGIVKKKRELYMVGQTRVHLDEVEGLGNFMELEVSHFSLLLLIAKQWSTADIGFLAVVGVTTFVG